MNALLWIGSIFGIFLWLTGAAFIGRRRHLDRVRKGYRYAEPGISLLLGLFWPIWIPAAIVVSPIVAVLYVITMPAPEDRRNKKMVALREEQREAEEANRQLQANIKRLEGENAEIDALLAKIQGAS